MLTTFLLTVTFAVLPVVKPPDDLGINAVPLASTSAKKTVAANSWIEEEVAGTTTHDLQSWGNSGNRVVSDTDGNAHICWTYSEADELTFPDMAVYYNVWDAAAEDFVFPVGTKVSGSNRSGYCTMGLLSDGRAVIAFNEKRAGENVAVVAVDVGSGLGVFTPKLVDDTTVHPQPLYPHLVVDANDNIHVVAHSVDSTDMSQSRIYYSRSSDEGASFSAWMQVADETALDAAIATSRYGQNVAVVWVEPMNDGEAPCGHLKYRESIDGGSTWGDVIHLTEGRYASDLPIAEPRFAWLFAHLHDLDAGYDFDDNLHILFCDGWCSHASETEWKFHNRLWSRVMHYSQVTDFNRISSPFPMLPLEEYMDTMGMWGTTEEVAEYTPYGGCWRPQISFGEGYGDVIVALWCGQRDTLDISSAQTINADIYAAMSFDCGDFWSNDYDPPGAYPISIWDYITNVTRSHSPGSGSGECADENYLSTAPYFIPETYAGGEPFVTSLLNLPYTTYIHDLYAGPCFEGGTKGYVTENPVMLLSHVLKAIEETPASAKPLSISCEELSKLPVEIHFSHPLTEKSVLRVHNVAGQKVCERTIPAGASSIAWDGLDAAGKSMSNGVYFIEVRSGQAKAHGRVTIIR